MAMVAKNEKPDLGEAQGEVQAGTENLHPQGTHDYYLYELDSLETGVQLWVSSKGKSGIDPLAAKRAREFWTEQAVARGLDLAEASIGRLDPIRRLFTDTDLVNHNAEDLKEIKASIEQAEALGAGELDVKKKWLACLAEALRLQRKVRDNAIYFAIYVLRCQQTNRILRMEKMHVDVFRAWNSPDYQNSLIEAPPGAGKTTMMYGQDLFEICYDRKLRFLKMCSDLKTAKNRLQVTRDYLRCRRLRALFPNMRIDATRPDNQSEFTVVRENIGSQDPTMQAAGSLSAIQGAGYDRLCFDDLCDPKVRREPSTRSRVTENFRGVAMMRRRDFLNARVRYICTPWHIADTAATLLRDIRAGHLPQWVAHLFPVKERPDGTPIPPTKRPGYIQELLTIKQTNMLTYACCCLLNPNEQSQRYLKKLVYYDVSGGTDPLCPEDHRAKWKRWLHCIENAEQWQVLDPAAGGADDTGMVGFAIGAEGNAAIRSARFFRGKSTEAIEPILDVVTREKVDRVLIEGQGGGKGQADLWASFIIAKLGEAYRDHVVVSGTNMGRGGGKPAGQNKSKGQRYRNILPYLENGAIMFPGEWQLVNDSPRLVCVADLGLAKLHEELTSYPNVMSDNGLDCVSMFANFNLGRLVREVETVAQPEEPKVELPPTRNPLTLMRRALQVKMDNPEKGRKGVREQEYEFLEVA